MCGWGDQPLGGHIFSKKQQKAAPHQYFFYVRVQKDEVFPRRFLVFWWKENIFPDPAEHWCRPSFFVRFQSFSLLILSKINGVVKYTSCSYQWNKDNWLIKPHEDSLISFDRWTSQHSRIMPEAVNAQWHTCTWADFGILCTSRLHIVGKHSHQVHTWITHQPERKSNSVCICVFICSNPSPTKRYKDICSCGSLYRFWRGVGVNKYTLSHTLSNYYGCTASSNLAFTYSTEYALQERRTGRKTGGACTLFTGSSYIWYANIHINTLHIEGYVKYVRSVAQEHRGQKALRWIGLTLQGYCSYNAG